MNISIPQQNLIITLSVPPHYAEYHMRIAYNTNVLNALERRGLVEYYNHGIFNGAVRLTEDGRKMIKSPETKFIFKTVVNL